MIILDVPIPRFEGVDIEPYKKPEQNNIIIADEDRERYKDMFYKLNPINGVLEGIFIFEMYVYNYFVFDGLTLLLFQVKKPKTFS